VLIKSVGFDAKYFGFVVPAIRAVVDVIAVTTPVVAIGIAVMTALPSLVLPPVACVCAKTAPLVPKTFVLEVHAVIAAHEDPPPPAKLLPPPP
jgi:hypothetical protein